MKQISRRLPDITTSSDQDSRHVLENRLQQANFSRFTTTNLSLAGKMPAGPTAKMAVLLGSSDFNLVKHAFLNGPDLLQPDQFKKS
jgi:hypothetical protein